MSERLRDWWGIGEWWFLVRHWFITLQVRGFGFRLRIRRDGGYVRLGLLHVGWWRTYPTSLEEALSIRASSRSG